MKNRRYQELFDKKIEESTSIAVCQVLDENEAVNLAKNLLSKGVSAMEIAYRNLSSLHKTDACIRAVRENVPEMLLGAATVINASLAKRAVKSGAQFILSPGFNPSTVRWCFRHKIPVYPGVLTSSEIERALEYGLTLLKFFPAEAGGGIDMLKSLSGPFPEVRFIVSGGINHENEKAYLALKNVACVSGSYLSLDKN